MEMRKIQSKKAQEGLPVSLVIVIIIAVVFLIGYILVQMGLWGKVMSGFGNLPDDFTVAAAFCTQYAGVPSVIAGYCGYATFQDVTIAGEKQKVNCDYLSVKAKFDTKGSSCDSNLVNATAKATCLNTALKLKDTYKINGQPCSYWKTWMPTGTTATTAKCTEQAGNVNAKSVVCAIGKCGATNVVSGEYSDVSNTQVCCNIACKA